ncbi:TPA: pilin [Stenotrophomonas maltophilia]|nr:pilin [Stenotrophomonas maltophilia]
MSVPSQTDATNKRVEAVSKVSGATGSVYLTATLQTNGQVTWVCGGTVDKKYLPGTCQAGAGT